MLLLSIKKATLSYNPRASLRVSAGIQRKLAGSRTVADREVEVGRDWPSYLYCSVGAAQWNVASNRLAAIQRRQDPKFQGCNIL